jgi:hypothetical protein
MLRKAEDMVHLFKCPACGHKHSIPEELLGKKLICKACDEVFPLSPSKVLPDPASLPVKKTDPPWRAKILRKVLADPSAAVDGAIPGAVSGILAGVLVPLLVGIVSSVGVGETISKVMLGFVWGFGLGAFLGALLGVTGRRLDPAFRIESGYALLLWGGVIGTLAVILVEPVRWLPFGAAIGALGANLWPLVCKRVESAAFRPNPKVQEEDASNEEEAESQRLDFN